MAMASSSPSLQPSLDWPALGKENAGSNSLALPSSPTPHSLQEQSSNVQQSRTWDLQLLGGEQYNSKRQSRSSLHNDPIGSRPGSRAEAADNSKNLDGQMEDKTSETQRPDASVTAGVFAAASSAAARSRATSPAQGTAQIPGSGGGGFSLGMMGLGTSYTASQPFRLERSSSPSFFSAQSHSLDDQVAISSNDPYRIFPQSVDAPTFKVDGANSLANHDDTSDEKENNTRISIKTVGLQNKAGKSPLYDYTSPTGSAMSALAEIRQDRAPQQTLGAKQFSPQRIEAGAANVFEDGSRPLISSPTPLLGLPQAFASSGGLLSPTIATHGSGYEGNTTRPFSPFESPPKGMLLGMSSSSLAGQQHSRDNAISSDSDPRLQQSSSFVAGILDRLNQVENNVQLVQRNISNLDRNVARLLERIGDAPVESKISSGLPFTSQTFQNTTQSNNEDLRNMSVQIAQLTNTASQMMMQNNTANSANNAMTTSFSTPGHASPLAGLGLGSGTPQLNGPGSYIGTPQLGTLPGTPHTSTHNTNNNGASRSNLFSASNESPRTSGNLFGGINQQNLYTFNDRNSRLSPRPGASPSPTSRRWSSMVPGTPEITSHAPNGVMNPPEANVIVTKWEHLNLHQDLLRSILKYGLGPPNKIQQRALPFLLRGSDIIAQAPPTQERIASYIIPVLQLVLNVLRGEMMPSHLGVRGPIALIISTTVDQATQAQRMALGLGSTLGIRVHIAAASSLDVAQEAASLIQMQPQIVVGTPQKMMDLFNYLANKTKGAISLEDIRLIVLDEVDQLIARNLADYVSTLLRILPQPRIMTKSEIRSPSMSPGLPPSSNNVFNPYEAPLSSTTGTLTTTDRQTAIFSNTVPQDVLNFAQSIHLRESVRVLVRRENSQLNTTGLGGVSTASNSAATGTLASTGQSGVGIGASAVLASSKQPSQQTPSNAVGSTPAYNNLNPLSDPLLTALRGLRQYYVYVAVSTGGNSIGGLYNSHPKSSQMSHATEMKLDVITDLLEDIDFGQAIIYTSSSATHEAVTYKLASKSIEALALHRDMANTTRQQVLAKYRSNSNHLSGLQYHHVGSQVVASQQKTPTLGASRPISKKALVVYDVVISPKDVHQVPLIVFYDLPRTVEEYKEKISCATSTYAALGRPSVCVNVVTGSGGPRGDIEMLRTLECQLGCKMAELPMNPSQILNF